MGQVGTESLQSEGELTGGTRKQASRWELAFRLESMAGWKNEGSERVVRKAAGPPALEAVRERSHDYTAQRKG